MTQVTGILTDEVGTVLANTTCAVVAVDQVVGQDGGGRVSRGSIVVTDGSGEFDADIKPGRYELAVEVAAPADANVKFSRIGRLTVLTTGPMTLEEALDTSFGPINPSILQQAIDAKDAAEAAAASINLSSIAITGGTINGTSIGATTASTGAFTTLTTTGDVTIPDRIIHAGNTNTQIRFPANNTVTVETSGFERMRIDSGGHVLVGTTSNATDLAYSPRVKISGNGPALYIEETDESQAFSIAVLGGNFIIRDATALATRCVITSTGNVGIGPGIPTSALTVQGTITGTAVTQSATDTTSGRLIRVGDGYVKGSILGTVSQSSGVPTGAVIQRGSNANGEFVRFADGTQICTRLVFRASEPMTTAVAGIHVSDSSDYAFPASFAANPVVSLTSTRVTSVGLFALEDGKSSSQWRMRWGRVTSFTQDVEAQLTAIGRWF